MDTPDSPRRHHDLVVVLVVAAAVVWWALQEPLAELLSDALGGSDARARTVVSAVPLVLAATAVLRVLRDVRRRERLAARREELAAAELRRAQHLREAFLQGISHELRTPLTAIVGFSETLREHAHRMRPGDVEVVSERLVDNARRLERLVLGLTDVESLVTPRPVPAEPGELGALVRDTVAGLDHELHRVTVTVADEHTQLRLDRQRMRRLIEELVGNAIRHTPPGSTVEVTVFTEGDAVVLIVDDDGRGVDELSVDVVFDPFHQQLGPDLSHAPGLGIGLTLVERYARLHGGTSWCETSPLGGARFAVRFPVHGDVEELDRWPGRSGTS